MMIHGNEDTAESGGHAIHPGSDGAERGWLRPAGDGLHQQDHDEDHHEAMVEHAGRRDHPSHRRQQRLGDVDTAPLNVASGPPDDDSGNHDRMARAQQHEHVDAMRNVQTTVIGSVSPRSAPVQASVAAEPVLLVLRHLDVGGVSRNTWSPTFYIVPPSA